MKKFQLTRRSLIVSTRVAATVAIFLNLATGKVERCVGRKLELILHEDFIKKVHFYFLRRATAYLAFWSSICCPEYIFLLGSWSTLPERVPSSLFAFRTLSMKEWLFIWFENKGVDKESESSPLLQRGRPPSQSPEREQSSLVCPASWTTLSRALG